MNWQNILTSFVTGLIGGGTAVFGLFRFFGDWFLKKVDARHNKELERLKAAIENSTFVTRAHFDTEFKAMKDVFGYLTHVRFKLNELRPGERIELIGEPLTQQKERLWQRLKSLSDAHNELLEHTELLSPFYPQELFDALRKCINAARTELTDVTTGHSEESEPKIFTPEWYKQGRVNQEKFLAAYDDVSTIIRERLSTLAVLPST